MLLAMYKLYEDVRSLMVRVQSIFGKEMISKVGIHNGDSGMEYQFAIPLYLSRVCTRGATVLYDRVFVKNALHASSVTRPVRQ